jgi:hypothetical protein
MRKAVRKRKLAKTVSLFLAISVVGLSGNLLAGERHGATVVVQKKDGQRESGELIAVKENSILLLGFSSARDVTIDVQDIRTITIVNESRALSGLGWGLLVGGALGAGIGFASGSDQPGWFSFSVADKALLAGVVLGVVGGLVGLTAGALAGHDQLIQIEGKSDEAVQAVMRGLKQKARIPNAL